jgi:hypothetical protein
MINKIDNKTNTGYQLLATGHWKTLGREYGYVKDNKEYLQIRKLYRMLHNAYQVYI